MDLVKSLPEVFEDRFVGFGTYDVNRPDGATHWVLVSEKFDDHLKFIANYKPNILKRSINILRTEEIRTSS